MNKSNRVTLGSKLSAILVAAGSAIGLGNIWRFPYVAGENGGGAFLLLYLLCVLLVGIPIMLAEFSIGRSTHSNSVGAFAKYSCRWKSVGYIGILTSFTILGFYFVVSGWTLSYLVNSVSGELIQYKTAQEYTGLFDSFIRNPWKPVLYTCLFVAITHTVITLGVKNGIERTSKILMPLLFIVLIALAVHSILMPHSAEGIRFFFRPDFSKVTGNTLLVALGQAFFSLSIGMGCMITYASYFKRETNLRHTAASVTILSALVAVLAGIVIFPAVFSVGLEPTAGPSLVFITLPAIFNDLPLSALWSSVFFLLLVVAALTSTISLHEVLTAYVHEEWHLGRKTAAWAVSLATAGLASLASLSMGVLNGYHFYGFNLFHTLDFASANILLPLGGFFTCLFAGWRLNARTLESQLTNDGTLKFRLFGMLVFLLRWFCPGVLVLVFLDNLGVI